MPTRLKQPPVTEHPTAHSNTSSAAGEPTWKWKVFGFIIFLMAASAVWTFGPFQDMMKGPKTPLPRETAGFSLGMPMDEILQKYPLMNLGDLFKENPNLSLNEILKKQPKLKGKITKMKKTLRPFNGDPNFGIATIMPQAGLAGAGSVDLLFYLPTKSLYFVSVMWNDNEARSIPILEWANNFRRWVKTPKQNTETLSPEVQLKEWRYVDPQTEMTVRDLNYSGHTQRWQDLRDATNDAAQSAFSKYRLETGS